MFGVVGRWDRWLAGEVGGCMLMRLGRQRYGVGWVARDTLMKLGR